MSPEINKFFTPVDETSLRDQVANNIRRAIDAGALTPGERLVEADIAAQMGTSRAPVREAIHLLEQEGLVTNIPRRGSFVIELDRKDIEEIFSLRSVIEVLAVREALPRLTAEDLEGLDELVKEMINAAEERDMARLVESDLEFHQRIVHLADHSRLLDVWQRMYTQLRLFLAMKDQLYDNPMDVADTHVPLLEALRSGDVETAHRVINNHIINAGELLLSSLNDTTDTNQREDTNE
jgi:DNA-binding GntR family transcriptional regulator